VPSQRYTLTPISSPVSPATASANMSYPADKGLVMFTGCSHAGVVNAARHTLDLHPDTPLYAVMGGFHLADAEAAQIASTAQDLKGLGVKVLLAGHCTGWRAKFEIQRVMEEGSLVPSFVGSKFVL